MNVVLYLYRHTAVDLILTTIVKIFTIIITIINIIIIICSNKIILNQTITHLYFFITRRKTFNSKTCLFLFQQTTK